MTVIHWFRRDLRVSDNTALSSAVRENNGDVLPVFILDDGLLSAPDVAPARVQFMLDSLRVLDVQLQKRGGRLIVRRGHPAQVLTQLAEEVSASTIYFNRDYTPAAIKRDELVTQGLQAAGREVKSFKDQVLHETDELLTHTGKPYTVFTPYKKSWLNAPKQVMELGDWRLSPTTVSIVSISDLKSLITNHPALPTTTQKLPQGGELVAQALLKDFVEGDRMQRYNVDRDFPGMPGTSQLSPHLRFGTISPRQCYYSALKNVNYVVPSRQSFSPQASDPKKSGGDAWISELIWREFYMQVLYHFPHANHANFNKAYDTVQWGSGKPAQDAAHFKAWCEGRTGYPIIDAAMRQLNQTGWMHNRLRMIVASFLTKDLLIHWPAGESYFMQKLVDGDPASNNGGWQWAASTGTDAQPYFRIFNPKLQSERFDPKGDFIRQWVPELARVPVDYVHEPGTMPNMLQIQVNCVVGHNYPAPIVDHTKQKDEILARFKAVKS